MNDSFLSKFSVQYVECREIEVSVCLFMNDFPFPKLTSKICREIEVGTDLSIYGCLRVISLFPNS